MKVLVTDDDADCRELVRYALSTQGVQVIEAGSGAACLKLAEEFHPDAILLDVMMPFMDGPATLAALRADPMTASIPVIFLTASVMVGEMQRLQALGARAVIAKPFEPGGLWPRVREVVTPAPTPMPASAPVIDDMSALRAQFVARSQTKVEIAARVVALLRDTPADRPHLEELMRFFHSLSGVGTSFGYPRVTALAKEGELACLALIQDGVVPSALEIQNWTRLLAALAHELSQPPLVSVRAPAASTATRLREIFLASSDAVVAATLVPLLSQEGHSTRSLGTRAEAVRAVSSALPDALLVDAELEGGSPYDVVDELRRRPGGDAVPVLVMSPRAGFLDRVEAIHGGADGYFEKPVDGKDLMRRLDHLLEANRTHAARILSVEDDPQQAAYLRSILESGGYQVAVCEDPKAFETALGEFQPDLVLMDILLPDITGYDLVRYLRQDERHATLPVLFLTTEGQLQSRFRSAQAGGDDHLTKPVVPPVLLSLVASRLERARLLKNLLNRDGLTRLYTHTALLERAQALHAQKSRDAAREYAWVMIDLDHFKSVNDRFGHPVGDRVLAALAALLRRRLRQSDTIGRYGGEEFVVLFEGLPEAEVLRLMERVLEEFREMDIAVAGKPAFRVTFSAGIAMLAEDQTLDEWKKAADDALYASKAAGRNRLTAAGVTAALPAADEGPLVPKDDGEERAVDVQAAVVVDEAHLPEPVHEEADP